jgi:type IV fimbrial biogenesis protein FimT
MQAIKQGIRRRASYGLTFIELLLVLGICGFLLLRFAQPSWQELQQRKQVELMMAELQQSIAMARSSAVSHNSMVTLCRSNDGSQCRGRWKDGSILFTDANADHILNEDDRLLFRLPALAPGIQGNLAFNAFRNRQYLQMTPQGSTNFQNGNFTWCPTDGNLRLARQLIVSVSGRTRMARDSDRDGIVENSQGQPLDCGQP